MALGIVALISDDQSYPQLFKGLGEMPLPYRIDLEPGAQPYAVQYPRRLQVPLMPKFKRELDRLESLDVIKKITVPTDWCAPMVALPKPYDKSEFVSIYKFKHGSKKGKTHSSYC